MDMKGKHLFQLVDIGALWFIASIKSLFVELGAQINWRLITNITYFECVVKKSTAYIHWLRVTLW